MSQSGSSFKNVSLDRRAFLTLTGVAAGAVGLALAGCAPTASSAGGNLVLWKPPHGDLKWEEDFFGALVQDVAKPLNLKGSALIIPWETIETKYTASWAAGGTPPDVTFQVVPWLKKYSNAGKLADLRELTPDLIKNVNEKVPQSIQDVATGPNGEIFGIPMGVSHFVLGLNTSLWEAAGKPTLPKTYEDLIPFAQALTVDTSGRYFGEAGFDADNVQTYGYAFATDPNYFANYLWAYGATELNETLDDIGYDSDEGRAALTVMKKMLDSGGAVPLGKYPDAAKFAELVPSGLAAFGWMSGISDDVAERYPDLEITVLDIPKGPEGQYVVGGAGFWTMSEGSVEKDGAGDLLAALSDPSVNREFLLSISAFPAAGAEAGFFDDLKYPLQQEVMNAAIPQSEFVRLNVSAPFNPSEAIINTTADFLLGRSSLDDAIASASSQIKTLAANAG